MSTLFMLMAMLAMHIFEDFHLQGIMASMKQKSWWDSECAKLPKDGKTYYNWQHGLYKYDHIPVLLLHGFGWAFCVALPCFIAGNFEPSQGFCCIVIVMGLIHSFIDHLKANKLVINLVEDQALHMIQILIIFGAYVTL